MSIAVEEQYRLLLADVYELAGRSRRTSEGVAASAGLTVARWHVLSVLSDAPATVPAVAARLGLARQSVQRVVDDLLAEGRLVAFANPAHRRSPLLTPSDEGRRALAAVVGASDEDRRRRLQAAGITTAELAAARDTVRRVLAAIGRSAELQG